MASSVCSVVDLLVEAKDVTLAINFLELLRLTSMYSIFKKSLDDGSDGSALTCLIHFVIVAKCRYSEKLLIQIVDCYGGSCRMVQDADSGHDRYGID